MGRFQDGPSAAPQVRGALLGDGKEGALPVFVRGLYGHHMSHPIMRVPEDPGGYSPLVRDRQCQCMHGFTKMYGFGLLYIVGW